jgi:hypothetical protein
VDAHARIFQQIPALAPDCTMGEQDKGAMHALRLCELYQARESSTSCPASKLTIGNASSPNSPSVHPCHTACSALLKSLSGLATPSLIKPPRVFAQWRANTNKCACFARFRRLTRRGTRLAQAGKRRSTRGEADLLIKRVAAPFEAMPQKQKGVGCHCGVATRSKKSSLINKE